MIRARGEGRGSERDSGLPFLRGVKAKPGGGWGPGRSGLESVPNIDNSTFPNVVKGGLGEAHWSRGWATIPSRALGGIGCKDIPVVTYVAHLEEAKCSFFFVFVLFGCGETGLSSTVAGDFLGALPDQGYSAYQLDIPQGIFVATNGDLYIADSNNHRVVRWDQSKSRLFGV